MVFIRTSPFRRAFQCSKSVIVSQLVRLCGDSAAILHSALSGLKSIYRPGFKWAKAGVMLLDLQSNTLIQSELEPASRR
jgi:DNA polymerase V